MVGSTGDGVSLAGEGGGGPVGWTILSGGKETNS